MLLADDNFAVNKIFSLVNSGQIKCNGNIVEILRGTDLDMLYRYVTKCILLYWVFIGYYLILLIFNLNVFILKIIQI